MASAPNSKHLDPEKIKFERDAFDLVRVGSLFTHLDSHRWTQFLEFFRRILRPGGVLIFSTHGRRVYDNMKRGPGSGPSMTSWQQTATMYAYERKGFGYCHYPNSTSYGNAYAHPTWVFKQIERLSKMRIVHFSEAAWDNNLDIYACLRDPNWHVNHPPIPTLTLLRQTLRLKHRLRNLRARISSSA